MKAVIPTVAQRVNITEVVFSVLLFAAGGLTFVGFFGTHMIEVFVMLDITNHTFHRVIVKPSPRPTHGDSHKE